MFVPFPLSSNPKRRINIYLFLFSFFLSSILSVSKLATMAQAEGEVPTAPEADPPPVHPHSPRISERVRSIFRAGQRSRSRESNPDRIEVERSRSNSQASRHEEEGYSSDEEESEEDCLYRTYTENDPVGQIMLNLAKDNMALLKKAGI